MRPRGLLRGAGQTSPVQRGLSLVIPVCLQQDKGSCLFLLHSQGLEPPRPPCTVPTFGCLHIPAC